MDFLKLAKKRYACRKYLSRQVEPEKLELILEAGRVAPTGANRQPQRLVVVQSKEGMERLARCTRDFGAPTAVIVCADTSEAWTRKYDSKNISDIDASIVTDHMMLAAASLGLDTLWICMFTYIIHSGFISGYQNRYGDNLKPPTNVYHRMTA